MSEGKVIDWPGVRLLGKPSDSCPRSRHHGSLPYQSRTPSPTSRRQPPPSLIPPKGERSSTSQILVKMTRKKETSPSTRLAWLRSQRPRRLLGNARIGNVRNIVFMSNICTKNVSDTMPNNGTTSRTETPTAVDAMS